MKKDNKTRSQNVECHYNGLQGEEGVDLLRECIKSILDEKRIQKAKEAKRKKPVLRKKGTAKPC